MRAQLDGSPFRAEPGDQGIDRLSGNVNIAVPISWQIIGTGLLVILLVAGVFFATASYSRVETVPGAIVLDKGVTAIVPFRKGVIVSVEVDEGEIVKRGDVLVNVRSEEDMLSGGTAPAKLTESLKTQDSLISSQRDFLIATAEIEQSKLIGQIAGLRSELANLDLQIAEQRRLIEVAEADYERAKKVAESGFVSRREIDQRDASLRSRKLELAQIEQIKISKISEIDDIRGTIQQSASNSRATIAGLQSTRSSLAQQVTQAELSKGYALVSPVDGKVTALTARIGQTADNQKLMMIVPDGARPKAEFYVPTSAAGFIEPGQEVRVALDAFPFAKFGTLKARITDVAGASSIGDNGQAAQPIYLVTAEIAQPWLMAFGRKQYIVPGMTLTGRIITDRRSMLEWLFEPIYALRNREP